MSSFIDDIDYDGFVTEKNSSKRLSSIDHGTANVMADFGAFLKSASGAKEFEERWSLAEEDIRAQIPSPTSAIYDDVKTAVFERVFEGR